jgi:hypothetical protein
MQASEGRIGELIEGRIGELIEGRIGELIEGRIGELIEGRIKELIDERIQASEGRMKELIDGRIDASEERMKDFIRKADFDLETKIVGEFWKWGRSSDIRNREALSASSEASNRVQMVSERLLNAEDRISALERRRHEPPAAA